MGRITVLSGRPGCGKTFLTMFLAATVTRGGDWPDGRGTAPQGSVLILNAEDDPNDTLSPRLFAANADMQKVHLLKGVTVKQKDGNSSQLAVDLTNVDKIQEAIRQLEDCRLCVIDPIGSYLGHNVDSHRDNEVRSVLTPLGNLANELEVAVLMVCHNRKAASDFADDSVLGSRGFTGIARAAWHLYSDQNDPSKSRKLLLPGKNNLAENQFGLAFRIEKSEIGTPILRWEDGDVQQSADDYVAAKPTDRKKRGPEPSKRVECMRWLAQQLAAGPVEAKTIEIRASEAGYTWKTVRNAYQCLGVQSIKASGPNGSWSWRLPTVEDELASEHDVSCPSIEE
ncbi:kaic family protein : Uncharacterized protein OS=Pirellula staleyi (strain ATCC 27377 / DSM 6068 / ICPB 4128) GN=Psta_2746 PE=4 SV=1: AAA_25 [Tuwongella immobilis]|uniref:AAA+ ATPase domain-containing protein n=2 Tax=Tuwongella immobilis TaxID=692036 RepID=A0A6C2YI89_9BACT|nr:kaic family protein : Uncharacterized protein OS=Pirellula staleyi (strain ATCC 27377 / DSM 6068 / ICPB 4128) GN=Psta_2746 PE=4 SV=1: AAA_25 [Tuwongella immobilis]VTR97593.1 kaic family protein : Uncharacterized protein OS=Pirellula staleyi (strain ATCC 27377 / DSM 6068 / ICPB 4128) GN=Psta_2746 PE=4 SV=1: AAA_25 [Tuwongella immobilis]